MAHLVRRTAPTALRRCVLGPCNVQFSRSYGMMPSKKSILREMERAARDISAVTDRETMTQMQKRANDEYFKHGGGPLFPGTFVPLPLSRYPRSPIPFALYSWYRLKQWGFEFLSVLNMKLKSMPNWTTRPQWKIGRGKIAPTAKVMYGEMLSAFAAGDKATLKNLCLANFANKLTSAVDRRQPNEKTSFEIVRFTKPLFYPRVVAHQVHQINTFDKDMATEQAVVAISSMQRAARYNAATGELVPGSTRVQDKVEHVVLSRQVSEKTFQGTPWRIWGTVPATTLEGYQKEQAWIRAEQARRAGWSGVAGKK